MSPPPWPSSYKLFNINNFPTRSKLRSHLESRGIKDLLALELLEKLLCLDPKKRIDAQNAAMVSRAGRARGCWGCLQATAARVAGCHRWASDLGDCCAPMKPWCPTDAA